MAAGDRYLAANGAAVRGLITTTAQMSAAEYEVLGDLQESASWLNPAHEDNYYTAAAILPWNDQLDAAQIVLRRASLARPYDFQPAFMYAFHLLYFKHRPEEASAWLQMAAARLSDENERLMMLNYAARWMDRSRDLDNAIAVISAMAKQARRADFRAYLEQRIVRLNNLKFVRTKADEFAKRFGRPLQKPDELVSSGVLKQLPKDPFGFGYGMGQDGQIMLHQGPAQ
jgi:tetratricopeptide (TPR) repeat protein